MGSGGTCHYCKRHTCRCGEYVYDTFEDWYNEIEGFSLRSERVDFLEDQVKWLKAAFEAGKERYGIQPK